MLWLFSKSDYLKLWFFKRILEKALGNVWPVILFCIFPSKLSKFLIHFPIEVVSEEEGPETKEGVHFLWLSNSQAFSLWKEIIPQSEKTKQKLTLKQ